EPQTLPCLPGPRSTPFYAADPERPNRSPSRHASRRAVLAIKAPGRCRRSYRGRSPCCQSIIQNRYGSGPGRMVTFAAPQNLVAFGGNADVVWTGSNDRFDASKTFYLFEGKLGPRLAPDRRRK